MLILQTVKVNSVNSFTPGVNHDGVHTSENCNSIRAAGDQEIKAVSRQRQVFPQLSLQT